ncbi:MAG TPA: protein tyrosine phosphatase, partial [Phycisphaerae bacterium]|nr:protein tyrosine phosphatase [Phycisphaerae bacterium]
LVRIMGRNTQPPNEIARKYAADAGRPNQQLDFVLFLDASPTRGIAFEADEAAFRASVKRPRALVEGP